MSKLPETRFKGEEGKLRAANKIIAFWKMKSVRRKFLILKENTIRIQDFFKRKKLQLDLERNIIKRNQDMVSRFEERQNKLEKVYKKIIASKRI